jgi:hypothetical protein
VTLEESPSPAQSSKDIIDNLLKHGRGEPINLVYMIYQAIKKAPEKEKPGLIAFAAERFESIESSDEVKIDEFISRDELSHFRQRYEHVVDSMLESLIASNTDETTFYINVWSVVNNNFLPGDKERAFALYDILMDRKIPYFQVDTGFRMSDEEYQRRIRALAQDRAKLRFLVSRHFQQRTERADLILKHINQHEPVDQVVLMALLLAEKEMESESSRQHPHES